jgi:hypothetical protein
MPPPQQKPHEPRSRTPHLTTQYAQQVQFQRELAIISDENSRLDLARAYWQAQIAAEREAQHKRVKEAAANGSATRKRRREEFEEESSYDGDNED